MVVSAKRIGVGFLALATVLTAPLSGQEGSLSADPGKAQIIGAWRVNVSPELPGDPVFVNLAAMHADGTIVGFPPASPMPDGTLLSGSTGVWRRLTAQDFSVLFYSTMYNGDVLIGYQRVRARVRLSSDGQRFDGRFTNDILDPLDNVLVSIEGTVTARRVLGS